MKSKMMWAYVALLLTCFGSQSIFAREIAGVKLAESVVVDNQKLVLNGASIRKKFVFDIYVVALYLSKPSQDAKAIVSGEDKTPKRVIMVLLSDINVEMFIKAVRDNVNQNFTQSEKMAYFKEFSDFFTAFLGQKEAKKGEIILLDYIPKMGLRMTYRNKVVANIKNEKFYHAILRLWLGTPPNAHIKDELLGKKKM